VNHAQGSDMCGPAAQAARQAYDRSSVFVDSRSGL
jgi:hypothetical protein